MRDGSHSAAWPDRRPFYPVMTAFVASCFVGTLATDIAYWQTSNIVWADFSDWLVTIGVGVGYLTVIVILVEIFALRRQRPHGRTWPYVTGMIVAVTLATFDMLVHTRDAWTSVVPGGIVLSAAVVLVVLITAWMTRETYKVARAEVVL